MGFRVSVAVPEEDFSSGDFERLLSGVLSDILGEKGFETFGFAFCHECNAREAFYEDGDASQGFKVTCRAGVELRYKKNGTTPSNVAHIDARDIFGDDQQLPGSQQLSERIVVALYNEVCKRSDLYSIRIL